MVARLTHFDEHSAMLTNCFDMNKQFPDTFFLPSAEAIEAIRTDDLVKLIFGNKERMWVSVTNINVSDLGRSFEGALVNMPAILDFIECDDTISFEPKHIADIRSCEQGLPYIMGGLVILDAKGICGGEVPEEILAGFHKSVKRVRALVKEPATPWYTSHPAIVSAITEDVLWAARQYFFQWEEYSDEFDGQMYEDLMDASVALVKKLIPETEST